jgi:uncharacterized protein (DUF362 family)
MTHASFGLKNLWGCYPDTMRLLYHKNLDYKLSFLSKALKHKITIIDGTHALDGHGPMEGSPKKVNKILIGNDVVATDAAAANIMQLDINKIHHLHVAHRAKLGNINLKEVKFNNPLSNQKLVKFKPYKVKLDYLSYFLFRSVSLSKIVLNSFITPFIYKIINSFRPEEKRTYWADYNKKLLKE